MKKLLLASVSSLALAGMAHGADMGPVAFKAPPPPVTSWTGFYLGVDGGVVRHEAIFNDVNGFTTFGGVTRSMFDCMTVPVLMSH